MYLSNYLPEDLFEMIFSDKQNQKQQIEFRSSSEIELEKKPCGCMGNKIKKPESS
jgi:hypothetical protein